MALTLYLAITASTTAVLAVMVNEASRGTRYCYAVLCVAGLFLACEDQNVEHSAGEKANSLIIFLG
eukprot:6212108-Pleurochrysis_carterae.AAC.5